MIANKWTLTLVASFAFYAYLSLWSSVNAATVHCQYGERHIEFETDKTENIKASMVIRNDIARVFIKDLNNPSPTEDYINIMNKQNRNVLFPLKCEKM